MQTGGFPWLTVLIFLPVAGAGALYFVKDTGVRMIALAVTVADFLLALPLWWLFDPSSSHMQFVEHVAWITSPPIHYSLGLDGISLPLILMTAGLMPLCVLISWTSITTRVRSFMAVLLLMEAAMLGVFVALATIHRVQNASFSISGNTAVTTDLGRSGTVTTLLYTAGHWEINRPAT